MELWKALVDHHREIDTFFTRRDKAHINFTSFLTELLDSKESKIFIAISEGKVVGYLIAKIDLFPPIYVMERYGDIYDLIVESSYRRRSIGSELVKLAVEWFRSQKIERIEISVHPSNSSGYSFWKTLGFQEIFHRLYLNI